MTIIIGIMKEFMKMRKLMSLLADSTATVDIFLSFDGLVDMCDEIAPSTKGMLLYLV